MRTFKTLSLPLSLIAVVYALASVPSAQDHESPLLSSIKEKFKIFYNHAQQDRIYVQTDRSFYKPGETIWFTAYVRDAETLKPSGNSDMIHVELITPKGTTERHYKIVAKDGTARGDFDLSEHPGGIYKIRAYTEWQKNEDSALIFEKEITVQSVVMPRLKMKVDFEKKAYGKGDEVVAKLSLSTNANKPLASTIVKFKAALDGKNLSADSSMTDADGKVNLRFHLPADLNTIDGVVNAMIEYEGSTESVSRSIPIVLNKISIGFFPEGGDMVSGCDNRVAFRASNEFGKPADIEGVVLDSRGGFICQFSSYHFGMGEFTFDPVAGETYHVRITKPAGVSDEYRLPKALDSGYVLSVAAQSENALTLFVHSYRPEALSYIAQTRGKIYASGAVQAIKGNNIVAINTTDFPIGISQITLFDSSGNPQCERLVFVHKDKQLKIAMSTDKPEYKPREKVNMEVKVTDDKGQPMPGNFSLAVADDNLLSFADDRQGNILSKMLLEPELKEKVEEPNFYFDTKEAKSDKALDLLMMTGGWRHYVWQQILKGDVPMVRHNAEKAEVGGIVYDGSSWKPIQGAVVMLPDSKERVVTDKEGRYHFDGVQVSEKAAIQVEAPYYFEAPNRVYQYGNNNNLYISGAEAPLALDWTMPSKMHYAAVLIDAKGNPLAANKRVSIRFRVHAASAIGRVIYEEIDTVKTDKYGMIDTRIGQRKHPDISTSKENKYLEVGVDAALNGNYKMHGEPELITDAYDLFAGTQTTTGWGHSAGEIKGKIVDEKGEGLISATVIILDAKGKSTGRGAVSDFDGDYTLANLNPGKYDLKFSYAGYASQIMQGVVVSVGKRTSVNIKMELQFQKASEVTVIAYKKPLIDAGDTKIEQAITRDDIKNKKAGAVEDIAAGDQIDDAPPIGMPLRGAAKNVQQPDAGGNLTINGSRMDEVQYIVNGHRMMNNNSGSQSGLNVTANTPRSIKEMVAADAYEAADMANIPDMADNPDRGDVKTEKAEAKYNDKKMGGMRAWQKNQEEQGKQVVFYRAKEFAVKKYTSLDSTRDDFGSTVYWNGNVTTDASGRAKVSFTTNDLVSSFRATLEGFAANGAIGRTEYTFSTSIPFVMDAKIPGALVSGDKMMMPVFLKNATASVINGKLSVTAPAQLHLESGTEKVELPAHSAKVVYINATASTETGDGQILIRFTSDKYSDAMTRSISVVAKGFPSEISFSGQDMDKDILIHPENVVRGSMKISFAAYPNIMGELMSGVASILREPGGCFEQTSSSNYPNVIALQYLKTMNVQDEAMATRAKDMLDRGYKRLTGFETKENGYEWFGASPAHEALTAYGLMEFTDMQGVYPGVDRAMVDRTAALLLDRRDGQGGFRKNPKALDAFGKADDDVTNAYIVYALSEAGYKDKIKKEMDEVYKSAKGSGDPYIMALCANALFDAGDQSRGDEIVGLLLSARGEAAFWTGKKHSITRSTGEGLKVETSSLVLMALMKAQSPKTADITRTVKFLVEARSGQGGFGSTQATILALKALTHYAEYSRKTDESGTVQLYVNGFPAGSKDYAKGERDNIAVTGLEKYIGEGKQKIEVRFKGCKEALPYAMNISYNTTMPASDKDCAIGISTALSATTAKVGETIRLTTVVKNKTATGQPMTMAMIGLPAGLSVQPWQLKEMQERGEIDFYEIRGTTIAFYFRSLAPGATKPINLDLKADIPGEYDAPASSAYLYYTSELKNWVALDRVVVKPM